jgi:hypothetical protein
LIPFSAGHPAERFTTVLADPPVTRTARQIVGSERLAATSDVQAAGRSCPILSAPLKQTSSRVDVAPKQAVRVRRRRPRWST